MKNQYVGDIGDYGKYGLLRFLASHGIKIGVNWYLTENDGSTDGKFTTYLKNPADRVYDPELFDALQNIADHPDKTVKMIKQAGIIPDAEFFGEMLKSSSLKADARELSRRLWFNNSTLMLGNAELIFADPDNGISYRKTARTKDSEKFILPEDVAEYYNSGRNVVYYCHKGRRKQEAWEQAKAEIRNHIRDAQILAVTFHRGTQRSYIFVLHPDCYMKYEKIITAFLDSEWGSMFTWENVAGNAFLTDNQQDQEIKIILETLRPRFSVCKVKDYSGVDLTKPFCFTGTTDEENSLVCPEALVPGNTIERDDGWKGFRIIGQLDFSLIGILARISKILAEGGIGIFAISTYNTDYILTKEENFKKAMKVLQNAGYEVKEQKHAARVQDYSDR